MSITSRSVSWSRDSEAELRRLLEACRGNPVLESQLKERIEDAEDARDARAAIEEGVYVPYDEFREQLEKENDMDDLDLSKPCEATHDGGKWFPTVGPPVWDRSEHYGCFREDIGGVLSFCWYPRARIRNIRSPQYEPHNMESLLPLAGEWVHLRGNSLSVIPFSKITHGDVILDGMSRSYQRLADDWLWATGPHAGKPVAREVSNARSIPTEN